VLLKSETATRILRAAGLLGFEKSRQQ